MICFQGSLKRYGGDHFLITAAKGNSIFPRLRKVDLKAVSTAVSMVKLHKYAFKHNTQK